MSAPSTLQPPQDDTESDAQAAAAQSLQACARPLIALVTQLRHAAVAAPAAMKQALVAAVARFEREAAQAGCDDRSITAASYLLCVWVDEVVADTPWGAGGAGLLQRFHGESDGSDKVLRLLSRLAEQPRQHQGLLALFHACMSLGLQGRLRGAAESARQRETLRQRVYLTLPPPEPVLSPSWHSAVAPRSGPWRRWLLAGLLGLGLIALGVYTASRLMLAERVDRVFASMQQLASASRVPEPPSAAGSAPVVAPAAAARIAPLLADDTSASRLIVRDELHRSVITLAADRLFAPGSTQLKADQAPLLERVAQARARSGGKVLVIGHTDGADARTARLPSAWHQSQEWATQVAAPLRAALGAQRVSAEGAGDLDTRNDQTLPRRSVEIVLYP